MWETPWTVMEMPTPCKFHLPSPHPIGFQYPFWSLTWNARNLGVGVGVNLDLKPGMESIGKKQWGQKSLCRLSCYTYLSGDFGSDQRQKVQRWELGVAGNWAGGGGGSGVAYHPPDQLMAPCLLPFPLIPLNLHCL